MSDQVDMEKARQSAHGMQKECGCGCVKCKDCSCKGTLFDKTPEKEASGCCKNPMDVSEELFDRKG